MICNDSVRTVLSQPAEEMHLIRLMREQPTIKAILLGESKAELKTQDSIIEEDELENTEDQDVSRLSIDTGVAVLIKDDMNIIEKGGEIPVDKPIIE